MSHPTPTPEQLLDFARRFARELHGIEPPDDEFAERIEYVMWGRKQVWQLVVDGLVTESELRQLLIDHFDYECAHVSGRAWQDLDVALQHEFATALDMVLYGRPAAS